MNLNEQSIADGQDASGAQDIVDEQRIVDEVRKIVSDVVIVPIDEVEPDTRIGEDLDAESLDFVDITYHLEMKYGVQFYPGSALEKFIELFHPQLLEDKGVLTELGSRVLRARMPEAEHERLSAGSPTVGIEGFFTPRTFARIVKELLDVRPKVCKACGASDLTVERPSVLKCSACGAEIDCPTGEAYLEDWFDTNGSSFVEG